MSTLRPLKWTSHETTNYFPSKKGSICVNLIFGKCYLLTIIRLLFHTD